MRVNLTDEASRGPSDPEALQSGLHALARLLARQAAREISATTHEPPCLARAHDQRSYDEALAP